MADLREWLNMSGALQAVFQNQRSFAAPPGQQAYTTAGTFSWVAPSGVTSVSVVTVGSSGGTANAQKGGALSYKNNITVIPGNTYTVVVPSPANSGTRASFDGNATVSASFYNNRTGDGGGDGADNYGGGAGGYSGNAGVPNDAAPAGGGASSGYAAAGGGGGVGLLGQGTSGAAPTTNGSNWGNGFGGSGGTDGSESPDRISPGNGGTYGGGGGNTGFSVGTGTGGAVRIIWPGNTRSFPSTNTGNL